MAETAKAKIDGLALGRVLSNALAFVPARGKCPFVRLSVSMGVVSTTGTDSYAVGSDYTLCETSGSAQVTLTRKGAADLEAAARKDKKGAGILTVAPDVVTYVPWEADAERTGIAQDAGDHEALWGACDQLLERLERRKPVLPVVVAFQPDLLARVAKVKPVGESVADFYFVDAEQPVLVKYGESFRAAIMPITRDAAPEGALWA